MKKIMLIVFFALLFIATTATIIGATTDQSTSKKEYQTIMGEYSQTTINSLLNAAAKNGYSVKTSNISFNTYGRIDYVFIILEK